MSESIGLVCICDECKRPFRLLPHASGDADVGKIHYKVGGCASDPYGDTIIECPHCGHDHQVGQS